MNFLPADVYTKILQQEPQDLNEINISFPLQPRWQDREEMVYRNDSPMFLADLPRPRVGLDRLSFWGKTAVELAVRGKEQITYIYGKASASETEVALHICKH